MAGVSAGGRDGTGFPSSRIAFQGLIMDVMLTCDYDETRGSEPAAAFAQLPQNGLERVDDFVARRACSC